jgi:hypothetical protein
MRARLLIVSILLAVATSLGASDLWIHIRVTETGHRPTIVEVNLPLRLVERLAPMLRDVHHRDARIQLGHSGWSVDELRDVWGRLRNGEVVVEDDAELRLQHGLRGQELVIRELDRRNGSVVTLPATVIEALLAGQRADLDLEAAVRELARYGEGEIVSAQDDGTLVRVWLDSDPEPW